MEAFNLADDAVANYRVPQTPNTLRSQSRPEISNSSEAADEDPALPPRQQGTGSPWPPSYSLSGLFCSCSGDDCIGDVERAGTRAAANAVRACATWNARSPQGRGTMAECTPVEQPS